MFQRVIAGWALFGLVGVWLIFDLPWRLWPRREPSSDFVWRMLEPRDDVTPLELSAMFGRQVYGQTRPPCFRFQRDEFEDMPAGARRHFVRGCGPDEIGEE